MQRNVRRGAVRTAGGIAAGVRPAPARSTACRITARLLAVCGSKHRESYLDVVMAAIVGPIVALVVVIALGSTVGWF